MDVSKNSGTPKSSILIGFSIINHPCWGTPILETPTWSMLRHEFLPAFWNRFGQLFCLPSEFFGKKIFLTFWKTRNPPWNVDALYSGFQNRLLHSGKESIYSSLWREIFTDFHYTVKEWCTYEISDVYHRQSTMALKAKDQQKHPLLQCLGRTQCRFGWWFDRFVIFIPIFWGNDPIWRAYFSDGLVQPPTSFVF